MRRVVEETPRTKCARTRVHSCECDNRLLCTGYTMDHIRSQIQAVLADGKAHFTSKIANALNLTKRTVNQGVYSMQRSGTVVKVTESPPSWQLVVQAPDIPSATDSNADMRGAPLVHVASAPGQGEPEGNAPATLSQPQPQAAKVPGC